MYKLYIFKLDKHNFFRIVDRKILFNLTEFFLLLEAANSKLTVPEAVRGGDTTSGETKKLSTEKLSLEEDLDTTHESLPDISDTEAEDNTQGISFCKVNLKFELKN